MPPSLTASGELLDRLSRVNDSLDPYEPTPPHTPSAQPPAPIPAYGSTDLQHAGFVCPFCRYDLTGAVIGGRCPECGQHVNPQSFTKSQTNGMAVTSMVLGILSLALCIFYGIFTIILGPLGIIFGHIAMGQIRTGQYTPSSRSFAITGLICSYIGVGLIVLAIGSVILMFML